MNLTNFILAVNSLAIESIIMIYSQLLLEFGSLKTYTKTRCSSWAFLSYFCSRGVNLSQQAWIEHQAALGPHGYRHSNASWPAGQARARGGAAGAPARSYGPLRGGARKFTTLSRKNRLQGQVGKAGSANLPAAHPCVFAAARAELLATPGRVRALFILLSL